MPFRQKLRKYRDKVRDVFLEDDGTRISTPTGTPSYSNSPAIGAQQPVGLAPNAGINKSKAETSKKWKSLDEFARVLAPITNVFGPIKEMVEVFVECVDKCEMAGDAQVEYDSLRGRLEEHFEDLQRYFGEGCSLTMTSSMQRLSTSIQGELEYIKKNQDRGIGERYLAAAEETAAILASYRRIEGYLQRLSLNANLSMWRIVQEQAADSRSVSISSRVERLPSSLPAWYNSAEGAELKRGGCTPGTRVDVLANLLGWARDGEAEGGVYWLNGMAGTGKTTIAYSVCAELDASCQLGASFFCSRLRDECRNVSLIIPSIAYQLARFSRPFLSALSTALEKDPDVHGRLPHIQWDALISKPMLEVQHTLPEGLVVVIDALDECENKESTRKILGLLLSETAKLPIRFVVSSRPEPQIRYQMAERAKTRLVLHELKRDQVQADIEKYLREGLAPMNPSEAQIGALVEKSGILFIYAATAVRFIGYDDFQSDPEARLRTVLDGSRSHEGGETEEIDHLYSTILEGGLSNRRLRRIERDSMRQILYTVICAREPLTVDGLSNLLQIYNAHLVRAALRPLWSVLHVVGNTELVTTLHASFPDFMFDSSRSGEYHCDSHAHHHQLSKQCFTRVALADPQFNICGLPSSYLPDNRVPDIEELISKAIPLELFYACRYWADHVEAGSCALSVTTNLRDLLSVRLLLWMEVLNLKRQITAGVESMRLTNLEGQRELVELAHDAHRFIEKFASNPVSQSTPHIYISLLAFWPRSTPISKHYAKYTQGPVLAEGTALDRRQLAHLTTWAFEKTIDATAFSRDGRYVALSMDNEVLLVNLSSGRVILGPLKVQHNAETVGIQSIAFSPDTNCLFAGFIGMDGSDATVVGWDTSIGDTILGPFRLQGHTGLITCLSISSNCAKIATGSNDASIRLWNAQNGQVLRSICTKSQAVAPAFSPDGTLITAICGGVLYMWDTQTGDITLGPLTIPARSNLIAFTPDKCQIIFAQHHGNVTQLWDVQRGNTTLRIQEDRHMINCVATICVWDAQNGKLVLGPLEGHTGSITSVAFLPDGDRIISTCEGGLVCTWDFQEQSPTPSPISSSVSRITCVKFSPDGTRFASGSLEGTICVWDTLTGDMLLGPLKVHTSQIWEIALLNGRIIAVFDDDTTYVCDAHRGEALPGPRKSHWEGQVRAIAFSPDSKLFATGLYTPPDANSRVDVWDASTGNRVIGPLTDLGPSVQSIRFSPDGNRIVASSGAPDINVVVWDVSTGTNVFGALRGHTDSVNFVSYSHDGSLIASCSYGDAFILWDAYTGERIISPLSGYSNWIYSVGFSPDSTRLASCSDDRMIQIWDIQTGEAVFELPSGHEDNIASVEYSPDGTRILSLSFDGSVRIHGVQWSEEKVLSGFVPNTEHWTINKDGWVLDDQSQLLVWVPGDLRRALLWPRTQVVVAPYGYIRLKFDKSLMGVSWATSSTPH